MVSEPQRTPEIVGTGASLYTVPTLLPPPLPFWHLGPYAGLTLEFNFDGSDYFWGARVSLVAVLFQTDPKILGSLILLQK